MFLRLSTRLLAFRRLALGSLVLWPLLLAHAETPAPTDRADDPAAPPAFSPRPVADLTEAQIALARAGFSCGPIDGVAGAQTAAALRAFQERNQLRPTGQLDAATREQLVLLTEPLTTLTLSAIDAATFRPVPDTWLGKSEQPTLAYESALEWAAEHSHAHPNLIRQLNPSLDFAQLLPGARLTVPAVDRVALPTRINQLHIYLAAHMLEAFDAEGNVIAHFPVSIAQRVEKRPLGELHVAVVIPDPDYTFDPEIFPESAEARDLGRKLHLAPGPNNPVGVAWIGLDRAGYGIHGTPHPEKVGRTESHGCFRLANWDARTLLDAARVGLPVVIEP